VTAPVAVPVEDAATPVAAPEAVATPIAAPVVAADPVIATPAPVVAAP
jgi:hypothetical protein